MATPLSLDDTLGAAFLGHFVTSFLYGITTLQAYLYYRDQYKDALILKLSVLFLWILDTMHVGLITGAMYWYCVSSFTQLAKIQQPIWPIPAMIIVSNVSNSIVRGIFAYRLYRLSRRHRWIFPAIIAVCSAFIFVDATYFAVKLLNISSYAMITNFSWGLYAGLSVEAAVDLIVALSQCILLRGFETGIRSTDSAIKLLIAYSVNTGLLTSFCAFGALISYATAPHKFVYFAFYFALSKLYVNSMLATLNARGSLLGTSPRRRHRLSKLSFPSAGRHLKNNHNNATGTGGIEFSTVICADADAVETDSVHGSGGSRTKIDEEEVVEEEEFGFGYRA